MNWKVRNLALAASIVVISGCGSLSKAPEATTSAGEPTAEENRVGMRVLERVAPNYPIAGVKNQIDGCVVVSFEIRPDGKADKYQVLQAEPGDVFVKSTLTALNEWRFQPLRDGGRYAQALNYNFVGSRNEVSCDDPPSYEALNSMVGN